MSTFSLLPIKTRLGGEEGREGGREEKQMLVVYPSAGISPDGLAERHRGSFSELHIDKCK